MERKLADFRKYYNPHRAHTALDDTTPEKMPEKSKIRLADLSQLQWKSHCRSYIPAACRRLSSNSPCTG